MSTLVGFWDDKYGLQQKQKLLIFLFIGFVWSSSKMDLHDIDIANIVKFMISIFIFIFLVLFLIK